MLWTKRFIFSVLAFSCAILGLALMMKYQGKDVSLTPEGNHHQKPRLKAEPTPEQEVELNFSSMSVEEICRTYVPVLEAK